MLEPTKHHQKLSNIKLIPLGKNQGLIPIGIGEILRRIAGKVAIQIDQKDFIKAEGCCQLRTGHEDGSQAAIHGMQEMFDDDKVEKVLLFKAENAFNTIKKYYYTILNIQPLNNLLRLLSIST